MVLRTLIPALLIAGLAPAFAAEPVEDARVVALLQALRHDQAAARDALTALRAEPLAQIEADRVEAALDQYFEGDGRRRLTHAGRVAAAEVRRLPIAESALGLLWAELGTVVGGDGLQDVAERFMARAQGPMIQALDSQMESVRRGLDQAIAAAVGQAMVDIQGRFDAVVASRFPAWEPAIVVPVLPAPELALADDAAAEALVGPGQTARWGARGALLAAPIALRLGARISGSLSAHATRRAVTAVTHRVGRRVAGTLTGLGALLAAADTLIDLATIKDRYREELSDLMADTLRESLSPGALWRAGEDGPRADVRRRVETKLAAWLDEAMRRSEAVVDAAPALESPDARAFIAAAVEGGADQEVILARLVALQRTFGPAMLARHPLALLEELSVHADRATVAALAGRLGDGLVELYREEGAAPLREAERIGAPVLLELLADPAVDWRAVARTVPTGADPMVARGMVVCARLGLACASLGLGLPEMTALVEQEPAARSLLAAGVEPREALSVLLDAGAREGVAALESAELLRDLAAPLGPQRLRRLGQDPGLAIALGRVYHHAEATGRWAAGARAARMDEAWALAPLTRRHGEAGLRVYLATLGDGGERQKAEAEQAVALLERLPADVLLDPKARRLLLDHADAFYGDLLVGLFQWAGPMGAWAVRGVLLALLLVPLAIVFRMLKLLAGPRRRVA
ncbi:MAG: hypothetical protein R3F60_29195 [bacterium]